MYQKVVVLGEYGLVMVMVWVGRAVAKQALTTAAMVEDATVEDATVEDATVEVATVENELESATAMQVVLDTDFGCWFL